MTVTRALQMGFAVTIAAEGFELGTKADLIGLAPCPLVISS